MQKCDEEEHLERFCFILMCDNLQGVLQEIKEFMWYKKDIFDYINDYMYLEQ